MQYVIWHIFLVNKTCHRVHADHGRCYCVTRISAVTIHIFPLFLLFIIFLLFPFCCYKHCGWFIPQKCPEHWGCRGHHWWSFVENNFLCISYRFSV